MTSQSGVVTGCPPERVLIVSSFVVPHLGGVEQFVRWLGGRLTGSGHQVRVLSCQLPGQRADWLVRTSLVRHEFPWVSPTPSVLRKISEAVEWSTVVLLQDYTHPLCFWAALLAKGKGRTARTFVHGGPSNERWYQHPAAQYLRATTPMMARWAPPIAVSAASLEACAQLPVAARRIRTPLRELPLRVPLRSPRPGEPLRVVFAARLASEKAPGDFVAACDLVKGWPIEAHVYGDGPLRQALDKAAESRAWLHIHGATPWPVVIEAQRQAHAVVSSSTWDAGQLSLLEPLGMGTPAVATAIGDAREYLDGVLRQLLCPPRQPAALAKALDLLRSDYEGWQARFGERAAHLRVLHAEAAAEEAIWSAIRSVPQRAGKSRP